MVATLGGLDALVFTGGMGEHQPAVRARRRRRTRLVLGVVLDPDRNAEITSDGEIGAGAVRTLVVSSREDVEIAREVRRVLGG